MNFTGEMKMVTETAGVVRRIPVGLLLNSFGGLYVGVSSSPT